MKMWLASLAAVALIVTGSIYTVAEDRPLVVFPAAPDPSECVVSPISDEKLHVLPSGVPATPLTAPSEPQSPLSLFPNSANVEPQAWRDIEAIERQLVACYNAGDWRRAAALFTDDYLSRIVAASGDRVVDYFPAEPRPIDPMNWKTMEIDDIRQIEDGFTVVLVDYCSQKQVHYYLQGADGWRIDDSIDVRGGDDGVCEILPPPSAP